MSLSSYISFIVSFCCRKFYGCQDLAIQITVGRSNPRMNMFLVFSFVSIHGFVSFSFQKKHKLPFKCSNVKCWIPRHT